MKFTHTLQHFGFLALAFFGCVVVGGIISVLSGMSFVLCLHLVILFLILDIQTEVDGIAKTRKKIEDIISYATKNTEEVDVDSTVEEIKSGERP